MKYTIFDIETNGLYDEVNKIYCLSYAIYENTTLLSKDTITDYNNIIKFIENQEILVGHNIIRYDIPVLEKILNVKYNNKLIDTLAISWYLHPGKEGKKPFLHGLEKWGERFEIAKIKVEDWNTNDIELYKKRCSVDVEINAKLFHYMMSYLHEIYKEDKDKITELFAYLNFKFECLKEQEFEKITLDSRLAKESKFNLEFLAQEKIDILSKNMPKHLGKIFKNKPKNMYIKNGELSNYGKKWFKLLEQLKLESDTETIYEKPNPASPKQLKEWLFLLGWKPQTFKISAATKKRIAQVSLPFGAGLCPSVIEMFEKYPYLKELKGLYKINHRLGLFKSFLENEDKNGKIYQTAHSFSNTLRFNFSKPIVNLPKPGSFYGNEIRGCITVSNEDYIMIGADISGLEDNTKQHYIYPYDKKYVEEMQKPGFDPHIDIGVLAELITPEEQEFYKQIEFLKEEQGDSFLFKNEEEAEKYHSIKKIRSKAKQVNFSAIYGAGAEKIASSLKCNLDFAQKLHKTYWNRNKAVKDIAKNCVVKTVRGQTWLLNPLSKFWLFLKTDKDRFSTLNQNTGVFVFDNWLIKTKEKLKPLGIKVILQYHDELLIVCKKKYQKQVTEILYNSIKEVNEMLNLNVTIKISIDTGKNYAECH